MAAVNYARMPQQDAKEDKICSSAPAEIEMGTLAGSGTTLVTVVEVEPASVSGGWSTSLFDCSLSPSSAFCAFCVPSYLWSKTLTRSRVGCGFLGLLAAYLVLSLGSQYGFRGAGHELAHSFEFVYNTTTYTDYATTCAPLDWRECVADPTGPCMWMGKHDIDDDHDHHHDEDAEEQPGCRPRPVDILIDRKRLSIAFSLGLLGLVFALALVCLRACMRTRFRKRMGIRGTALGDCAAHTLVPCCALAQEARHADAAELAQVDWRGRIIVQESASPVVMGTAVSQV